jgi:hypothetical protein
MVGKKTDQVGRDQSDELLSDDLATFEKLNQAVNSCSDLVRKWVVARPPVPRPSTIFHSHRASFGCSLGTSLAG